MTELESKIKDQLLDKLEAEKVRAEIELIDTKSSTLEGVIKLKLSNNEDVSSELTMMVALTKDFYAAGMKYRKLEERTNRNALEIEVLIFDELNK